MLKNNKLSESIFQLIWFIKFQLILSEVSFINYVVALYKKKKKKKHSF